MPLNTQSMRRALVDFNLTRLFVEELGWDRYAGQLNVTVEGVTYSLRGIAEKRGMVAFKLEAGPEIPAYALRRQIESIVARSVLEHLIIYTDDGRQEQVWQWVRREPGKPTACREQAFHLGQTGEALVQRLSALAFSLEEEPQLTLLDVTRRARSAFDVERVTRRFYDRFKVEHDAFLGFITGLRSQDDLEWYTSLMLNRLMFVYFIEKKGFLDRDRRYLRNRLQRLQAEHGSDQFYSFYRYFLLRLFHEGLGQRSRDAELDALLGNIPYLNGGLFDVHALERDNPDINIPDQAFERLFDFFDQYQWHLDERQIRADNEINPDVLGYIFEKYINQKQMGAYYTKEDITEYMAGNAIVPLLLERVNAASGALFPASSDGSAVGKLLSSDPDRYIPPGLRHGVDLSLPADILAGDSGTTAESAITDEPPELLRLRHSWNAAASPDYALPSETWREVIARRAACCRVRKILSEQDVETVSELITLNLDLRQLAQDIVELSETPEELWGFWEMIRAVTVLDPACGSGAFLFAALNILEPLYEACIGRMEAFLRESVATSVSGESFRIERQFAALLADIDRHPNRRYYILKNIILDNLYGVDIMEEAVEICKLRLFLKLAAQVDPDSGRENFGIEPLPDIDFNIRAGNTLVGFTSYADVRRAVQSRLGFEEVLERVSRQATALQETFDRFRASQVDDSSNGVDDSSNGTAELKAKVRDELTHLQSELNRYLAVEYGVNPESAKNYAAWLRSHQPFHWFVEFYGIMNGGGFDLIVGNPPYVEYRQVRDRYTILRTDVAGLGNLHAMVTLVSLELLAPDGSMSMIVPVSLPSTDRFEALRKKMVDSRDIWLSHYDFRPGKLFVGSEQRLTIFVLRPGTGRVYSSRYNRWYVSQRPYLFECLSYAPCNDVPALRSVWPKLDDRLAAVMRKVAEQDRSVGSLLGTSPAQLYYKNTGVLYWTAFTLEPPTCFINGVREASSRETALPIRSDALQSAAHCLLNSTLFYVAYLVHSNCRDLNPSDIQSFRFPSGILSDPTFSELSRSLHQNQQENSRYIIRNQRLTGEVRLQSFMPGLSKPVLDEIDYVLANYYGFSERELDFIINYDVKYRLGADGPEV
jgi:Eco57I restriction-modification methylase